MINIGTNAIIYIIVKISFMNVFNTPEEKQLELQKKLYEIENLLNTEQLKFIQLKSLNNFLYYLPQIKEPEIRNEIINSIDDYLHQVELMDYNLTRQDSGELMIKYLKNIGKIYRNKFNFKMAFSIKYAIFIGIPFDCCSLLLGISKQIYYIPIISVLLISYSIYLNIFFKKRLYGYLY